MIESRHSLTADNEGHNKIMESRTRQQEMKYGQALGYAYGAKDHSSDHFVLVCNSGAFATFYSVYEDKVGHHRTLQDAFSYFCDLPLAEQDAYGREWMRSPWMGYLQASV